MVLIGKFFFLSFFLRHLSDSLNCFPLSCNWIWNWPPIVPFWDVWCCEIYIYQYRHKKLICTSIDKVLSSNQSVNIYCQILCNKLTADYQQTTIQSELVLNPPWFTKQQLQRKTRFANYKSNWHSLIFFQQPQQETQYRSKYKAFLGFEGSRVEI